MRIKVRNSSTGSSAELDMDGQSTIDDIIDNCTAFWSLDGGPYVVTANRTILRGQMSLSELSLEKGTFLELIPDPEGG